MVYALLAGLIIGLFVGWFTAWMCFAARRGDEQLEKEVKEHD